ncbi:MAG: hypothetical protein PW734_10095 [Verrucomicrobium sp.]|nr:hypothetical protein [Verrucomicrobium sp.]
MAADQPELAALREENARLRQSLQLANADAEAFRERLQELRLREQAIGVDALTEDGRRLEARLVQAVRELYRAEEDRRSAENRLRQLLDAGQEVLKSAQKIAPQPRADYEVALRASRELLEGKGKPPVPAAGSLQEGRIVDVNRSLGAVIVNMGAELGVKPGMPFRVLRDEREIGRLKAFEVRETACAALVEAAEKEKEFKSGDRVVLAAQK